MARLVINSSRPVYLMVQSLMYFASSSSLAFSSFICTNSPRCLQDRYLLLSIITVVSTTPWDSYLILSKVDSSNTVDFYFSLAYIMNGLFRIWSYPRPGSVFGTMLSVPLEEHFFVVQTYITPTLLAKPVVHMIFTLFVLMFPALL